MCIVYSGNAEGVVDECLILMMSDFIVNDIAVVETIVDSDFKAGNIAQVAASESRETVCCLMGGYCRWYS
jgi:hypothetical protein